MVSSVQRTCQLETRRLRVEATVVVIHDPDLQISDACRVEFTGVIRMHARGSPPVTSRKREVEDRRRLIGKYVYHT